MKNKMIYHPIIKGLNLLRPALYLYTFFSVILMFTNINAQEKTQILILGTQHLSQVKNFNTNLLNTLITDLENYHFDAVCIENMPAQLLYDIQSRNDSAYAELIERWGKERLDLAKSTQQYLKIGFLEAQTKANEIFSGNTLNQGSRKMLIKYLLASCDLASAVLQYQYLMKIKGENTSSFDSKTINKLEYLSNSPNEIYSLAVRLAQKTGLQKIEYIDDFQDEAMLLKYFPVFISDYKNNMELFKNVSSHPVFLKMDSLLNLGVQNNNLLPLYLFLNSKEFQQQDFEAQWKIWLNTKFPSGSDKARYALWEMRNLKISANIMKTAAFYPGKKILVIIGASHKLFLEKYLQQAPNIRLLEFE